MTQTNHEAIDKIHELCNTLLTQFTEQSHHLNDKHFLHKKEQILRRILEIHNTVDLSLYLATPSTDDLETKNSEFLLRTNTDLKAQVKIYYDDQKEKFTTFMEEESKSPATVLMIIFAFYMLNTFVVFQSVLILGAILYFFKAIDKIVQMQKAAQKLQKECEEFSSAVNSILENTEAPEPVQPFRGFVQNHPGTNSLDDITPENEALLSQSDTANNTLLHALLAYKVSGQTSDNIAKIKTAVALLRPRYQYTRNNDLATPLFALTNSDPYCLKLLFQLDQMLPIGDVLPKIDDFFALLRRRPSETSRFLLLDGPPGTGKSDTVERYIRNQLKCEIESWVVGDDSDKYMGQLEGRITSVFSKIIARAKKNPSQMYVLYLDKVEVICPQAEASGNAIRSRMDNYVGVAEQFQRRIEGLTQIPNIVVVGTTTSALNVSRSLRSIATRILYRLPTKQERILLLNHLFIEKKIAQTDIQRIADLTEGWSQRELVLLVNDLTQISVAMQDIERALSRRAEVIQSDFKSRHPYGELSLPHWSHAQSADEYPVVTPQCIADCFTKLNDYLEYPRCYTRTPMHILMSGPPGGGKTTAVRNFAKKINRPFILIKSGIMKHEMMNILEHANYFGTALVFIDEIDQCSFLEFLQSYMDGFKENNIIIVGATNYPEKIKAQAAVWSRFLFKINVPPLSSVQRGEYLSWIMRREHQFPRVSLDAALRSEIQDGCPTLTALTQNVSMRDSAWGLQSLFGQHRARLARRETSSETLTLEQIKCYFTGMQR